MKRQKDERPAGKARRSKTRATKRSAEKIAPKVDTRKAAPYDIAAALPGNVLLHAAHQALRREGHHDLADVAEAAAMWPWLNGAARKALRQTARRARGKQPGRGRATDGGQRATLVRSLVKLANIQRHVSAEAFAESALDIIRTNAHVITGASGQVPNDPEPLTVGLGDIQDPEHMTAAVLTACGVRGSEWVKSAFDIARRR